MFFKNKEICFSDQGDLNKDSIKQKKSKISLKLKNISLKNNYNHSLTSLLYYLNHNLFDRNTLKSFFISYDSQYLVLIC